MMICLPLRVINHSVPLSRSKWMYFSDQSTIIHANFYLVLMILCELLIKNAVGLYYTICEIT